MKIIIGAVIVLASVIAGFLLSKGNLIALLQPFEVLIIMGAATGAFVIANPPSVIKAAMNGTLASLKGAKFSKQHYMDLLALLYELFAKMRKEGMMAIEEHIDEPEASTIFQNYPKILADHHVIDFIADYLRLMVGGNMNPYEIEALMDMEIDAHHEQSEMPAAAITNMSDALPGFGIVAAVLGIVITMGSLDGDTAEIGAHVAAALVGTFLGILLSYGFFGPLGTALGHMAREETKFYQVIKTAMIASLNGSPPQIAVEYGRKVMYPEIRPGFMELEDFVKGKKD